MIYCIAITALATFFITLMVVGIFTLFLNTLGVGALKAIYDFGYYFIDALIAAAIIAIGYFTFRLLQYMQKSFDEAIEKQKQERLAQLDELIRQKQEQLQLTQTQLSLYQDELEQIDDLQEQANAILKDLLLNSYNCIAAKERLIEALHERKSKDINIALSRNTISKKGAERALRKFNQLLQQVENTITQEKQTFALIANNFNKTIKQLQKQICEVKNE